MTGKFAVTFIRSGYGWLAVARGFEAWGPTQHLAYLALRQMINSSPFD